jgi:HEAT repeat protein
MLSEGRIAEGRIMLDLRSLLATAFVVALSGTFAAAQSDTSGKSSKSQYPTHVAGKVLAEWLPDLKNSDPSVREEAIRAAVQFGPLPSDVVSTLIERTTDWDCSPRVRATQALAEGEVKKDDLPRVIEALARRVNDDSQLIVRYHAALGLARYGDSCQPVIPKLLIGCSENPERKDLNSWEIRKPCIIALAKAGRVKDGPADVRVTRALTKALSDPAYEVKLEAITGLAYMGRTNDRMAQTTAETNLMMIVRGPNKILSIWATHTLVSLEHKDIFAGGIAKYLRDTDVRVRIEAARALGLLGTKARLQVRDLVATLSDPDPGVVLSVIGALVALAPDAHDALEPLGRMKNNKELDEPIRLAAGDAFDRISKIQGKR